jgi:heat shock protein HspQ
MGNARFSIGQLVQHMKFGYRGAIFGVDAEFSLSEEWYDQVAKSRPPKNAPWYHVMVDGAANTTYVAERHLTDAKDHSQINNPHLGKYFTRFDGQKYLPVKLAH